MLGFAPLNPTDDHTNRVKLYQWLWFMNFLNSSIPKFLNPVVTGIAFRGMYSRFINIIVRRFLQWGQ